MSEQAPVEEQRPAPVPETPAVHPPSTDLTRPVFRVCYLRSDAEGQAVARVAHLLAASVYDARQATRYAAEEARALERGSLLAVVSPAGRTVAVLMGGSGRRANALVTRRAARVVRQLLPEAVAGGRKARTSRPRTGVKRRR